MDALMGSVYPESWDGPLAVLSGVLQPPGIWPYRSSE